MQITILSERISYNLASEEISDRNVRMSVPPSLVYNGPVDNKAPQMKWITHLLYYVFSGKEITTVAYEGTF